MFCHSKGGGGYKYYCVDFDLCLEKLASICSASSFYAIMSSVAKDIIDIKTKRLLLDVEYCYYICKMLVIVVKFAQSSFLRVTAFL